MTDPAALQKLLTWLSPAFPVGAFAWSAGLETAIVARTVADAASLRDWIGGNLRRGAPHTDAILMAHAHRAHADREVLGELTDLCLALSATAERQAETLATGSAFVAAITAWPSENLARLPQPCPYPIAVGAATAAHDIPLETALLAFVTAAVQSQVSVAVRLVPLGQIAGLEVMAALEPEIVALASRAAVEALADLGAIAYATDIAQMHHERLEPRIFRS